MCIRDRSKSLGSRTVMSGSISRGKNDPSQSLQMMERPLMTTDELKSMPKGSFIVAQTGQVISGRCYLSWPLTDKERDAGDYSKRFTKGQIYRIKVPAMSGRKRISR